MEKEEELSVIRFIMPYTSTPSVLDEDDAELDRLPPKIFHRRPPFFFFSLLLSLLDDDDEIPTSNASLS